jgi:hypothetical protein
VVKQSPRKLSQPICLARKRSSKSIILVTVHDGLHSGLYKIISNLTFSTRNGCETHICARAQEKYSNDNEANVECETHIAPNAARLPESTAVVCVTHADVGRAPEDEAEEGVEQRTHQREQVREERDDLGDDKGKHPSAS